MTRIAVTGDLHVDPYFDARDPETGANLRELDMLRTVAWVARTARERGAEALVVAGDYTEQKEVSKGRGPDPTRIAAIQSALAEGPARQIHVRGNHDRQRQGTSIVTVLADHPGWSGYDAPGFELIGDVAVCAIPFLDRAWWRAQPGNETKPETEAFHDLALAYEVIAAGLYLQATEAGARAAILVGHQQMPAEINDRQRSFLGDVDLVVDPRALGAIGYGAIVFGHVHRAQTIVDDPACPILFVGSPERVDFAEEDEEKSFVVLDIEPGRPVTIERIPTSPRRFVTLTGLEEDVDVGGAVVRVVDLPPEVDAAWARRQLGAAGAFAVTTITTRVVEDVAVIGAMNETLTAEELLEADLADHPDRDALLALGRSILAEVA